MSQRLRLACLVSHPIQYQAPLFRLIAASPEVDLTVFFMNDHGVKPSFDVGLGKTVQFDVPLLEGYRHVFLRNVSPRPEVATFRGNLHPEFVWHLARGRFDALWVHGYQEATQSLAFAAAKTLGIPYLLRGESTLLYESELSPLRQLAKRALIGTLVKRADALLYVGEHNRRFYETYGAKPSQLFFAPYSVDNAFFAERAEAARAAGRREALRARVDAGRDDVVLLFVGKLIPRKRPLDVVAALQRLDQRAVAAFVGDGEQRAELEEAIARAGVRATVVGFANQSELPAWYAASDLFVLPSDHETWGLVVNEAMATGLPAVASDLVGCVPDLVSGHGAGASFRSRDVDAFAQALRPFVEDAAYRKAAGEAARQRVALYDVRLSAAGIIEATKAVASRR